MVSEAKVQSRISRLAKLPAPKELLINLNESWNIRMESAIT